GLGIGLTVARKLAEMHGGNLTADSEGLGKGSVFTLRLPISRQIPETNGHTPSKANTMSQPPKKVLVVDDNRDTAMSCAGLLKSMGHEVQTAFDGMGALEAARLFKPQAILLDIGLPKMNGFEVAKTLRDEGFTNEVIVAVSGYGQPEDRERSRQA